MTVRRQLTEGAYILEEAIVSFSLRGSAPVEEKDD